MDDNSADKRNDDNPYQGSDEGNVSGSDVSVDSDNDPGEEFDGMELDAFCDLEWINCHGEAETRTPILTLSESGTNANNFLFLSHFKW